MEAEAGGSNPTTPASSSFHSGWQLFVSENSRSGGGREAQNAYLQRMGKRWGELSSDEKAAYSLRGTQTTLQAARDASKR